LAKRIFFRTPPQTKKSELKKGVFLKSQNNTCRKLKNVAFIAF